MMDSDHLLCPSCKNPTDEHDVKMLLKCTKDFLDKWKNLPSEVKKLE